MMALLLWVIGTSLLLIVKTFKNLTYEVGVGLLILSIIINITAVVVAITGLWL